MKKILNAFKFVWKNNKLWLLITSIVLVVLFSLTMVMTQNLLIYETINAVLGGERRVITAGDPSLYEYYKIENADFMQYESGLDVKSKSARDTKAAVLAEANKFNEVLAGEGIILLENDGTLPLAKSSKLSVFGKNTANLVLGGSGSSAGNSAGAATIYESLRDAGYVVNPALESFYNSSASGSGREKNPAMGEKVTGIATGETPQSSYTASVKDSYSQYNDAAVVVFSRIGGEGFDLPLTMTKADGSTIAGANATDHYLQLDNNERDLLAAVDAAFSKIIVVINCSTSMELGFLTDGTYNNIAAAVWIGSPGNKGINALGHVLNGDINPSGRTVDTFSRDFTKDPAYKNFAFNKEKANGSFGNMYLYQGTRAKTDEFFVEYEEDIYVGYRYYETYAYEEQRSWGEGEQWHSANVVYPFGYGLSYSTFDWEILSEGTTAPGVLTKDGEITVKVKVTNNGPRAGKDVVQMYYTSPYIRGGIEKSHVVLGDFSKTEEIAVGGSDTVTLKLAVSDMASYDYADVNQNDFVGYELDAGNYTIRIAKNANASWLNADSSLLRGYSVPSGGFRYREDVVTDSDVVNRYDEVSKYIENRGGYMTRRDFEGSFPETPTAAEREVTASFITSLKWDLTDWVNGDKNEVWYTEEMPTLGWTPTGDEVAYKLYELIDFDQTAGTISVDYFDERWDNILNQLTLEDMAYLIGTGNYGTRGIISIGKPVTNDSDGPAGWVNFMGDPSIYDVCVYVSECVIAATWNKSLAHDMGVMVALEGLAGNAKGDGMHYSGWYAPAVNIHRTPFSGRNFEYYSEDSRLTGMMGAHVVLGAQANGLYTHVKHFAVNDQETDRGGVCTWLSEQAMREVYLKPFEIIVKVGKTRAIMSSFNRIGTVWTGGDYKLLTEILRDEWGFVGLVLTDYNTYPHMPVNQMIRAGGDLNLYQSGLPTWTGAAANSPTQVSQIRKAVKNILWTQAQSSAMNGIGEGVEWRMALPVWTLFMILGTVCVAVGFAVWGFFSIKKSVRKTRAIADID